MDFGPHVLFAGLVLTTVAALVAGTIMSRYRKVLLVLAACCVLPLLAGALLIRQVSLDESLAVEAMHGNLAGVRELLSKGASVTTVSAGGTPILICAVESGNKDVVELLIRAGADPNIDDGRGRSALSIAEEERHTEITTLLREKGAK